MYYLLVIIEKIASVTTMQKHSTTTTRIPLYYLTFRAKHDKEKNTKKKKIFIIVS